MQPQQVLLLLLMGGRVANLPSTASTWVQSSTLCENIGPAKTTAASSWVQSSTSCENLGSAKAFTASTWVQ